MKVQVILDQDSITEAIRDYVAKNGIATPVQDVEFTVARKGGTSITAEVILGNEAVVPPEPVKREATKPTNSEPKKKTKPSPEPEEEEPSAPEVTAKEEPKKEPEPASTEPPFEPDAKTESANDSTETKPTKESRSLFG